MKRQIIVATTILACSSAFNSCKPKEQPKPEEQELITTVKLQVTDGGSFTKTFTYKIDGGFGQNTPAIVTFDTIALPINTTFTVTTELYNESKNPAENLTSEVVSESKAHLFLYQSLPVLGPGSLTFADGSKDASGEPFNQVIKVTSGNKGTGTLRVLLMHAPTNKSASSPAAAGGETDVDASFPVSMQ